MAATIIKFPTPTTRGSSRSGRYATQQIYESTQANRDTGEPTGSAAIMRPQLLPRLEKDRPGMATDYSYRLAPKEIARIRLTVKSATHSWIDWVFTPPSARGTGVGRRLMDDVITDADAQGVRLSLEARACAGLDQDTLEAWYAGFGFQKSGIRGEFGPVMVRQPIAMQLRRVA